MAVELRPRGRINHVVEAGDVHGLGSFPVFFVHVEDAHDSLRGHREIDEIRAELRRAVRKVIRGHIIDDGI